MQSPEVIALQGLATGTLLYVVFFELLEKERQKKGVNSLIQVGLPVRIGNLNKEIFWISKHLTDYIIFGLVV